MQRVVSERANALRESADLRRRNILLAENEKLLVAHNSKLSAALQQSQQIIHKLKQHRKELLAFYKKHKKFQLQQAQITDRQAQLAQLSEEVTK